MGIIIIIAYTVTIIIIILLFYMEAWAKYTLAITEKKKRFGK